MTLDELSALAARVPELERRIAELEAANSKPPATISATLERAEELTGVSVQRLRSWIKTGALPASREKRNYIVEIADVLDILRTKRVRPAAPASREDLEDEVENRLARLPRRSAR